MILAGHVAWMERWKIHTKFFVKKPECKRALGRPKVDGRTILVWILKREGVGSCGLD